MFSKKYCQQKFYLRPPLNDFVAQLVEQFTLNEWVESSSLSEVTIIFLLQKINSNPNSIIS